MELAWDLFDAQLARPAGAPAGLEWPEQWLTAIKESRADAGSAAGIAAKVLKPSEHTGWTDHDRRLLGRELIETVEEQLSAPRTSTEYHEAALRAEAEKKNKSISGMHDFWLAERNPSPKFILDWTKAKNRFIEVFGDIKIREITRAHALKYREVLRALPKNPKRPVARLPALKQIEATRGQDLPRLQPATINKSLRWLKAMLNLAVDNGIIDANPAERVSQRDKIAAEDKRHPYSTNDLNQIFCSVLFGGAPPKGRIKHPSLLKLEHSRWLPILGLFQGARLNELGQLLTSDIRRENAIDFLAITTLDDEEDGSSIGTQREKRLKTFNAVRAVPLHPVLIDLGFLNYARRQRELGHRHLFPGLNHHGNQVPTAKFSSYWGPFTRSPGVTSRQKSFHSFRHNFRDAAEIMPEIVRVTIMGRSRKDVYGSRPPLPVLKEWNDRIVYPELDLDCVRTYFRDSALPVA